MTHDERFVKMRCTSTSLSFSSASCRHQNLATLSRDRWPSLSHAPKKQNGLSAGSVLSWTGHCAGSILTLDASPTAAALAVDGFIYLSSGVFPLRQENLRILPIRSAIATTFLVAALLRNTWCGRWVFPDTLNQMNAWKKIFLPVTCGTCSRMSLLMIVVRR